MGSRSRFEPHEQTEGNNTADSGSAASPACWKCPVTTWDVYTWLVCQWDARAR